MVLRSTEQRVDGSWTIEAPALRKLSKVEADNARLAVGDLVVTKSSGSELHIGKTSIVTPEVAALHACYSNFMQRLRVDSRTEPRFVHYWMNNGMCREQFAYLSNSTSGLANLNGTVLGTARLAFPARAEQERIANFLDEKTARIDALIAEKERLVDALEEHFMASLVMETSTGGAEHNLVPSNLPWATAIPLHWHTPKLAHLFNAIGSGTTPSTNDGSAYGEGTPWVTTSELRENVILSTEKMVTELAMETYTALRIYPTGSVLIAMYGATIGRLGILGIDATVNQACCALSKPVNVLPEFVFYCLWGMREHIAVLASGGGQPNINQDIVRNLRIPLPPPPEQKNIVKKLHALRLVHDSIRVHAMEHMSKLSEYRSSLISAAVTGQLNIDDFKARQLETA